MIATSLGSFDYIHDRFIEYIAKHEYFCNGFCVLSSYLVLMVV